MVKQLLGAVVGGVAAWFVGYLVFGLGYPMVFNEAPTASSINELIGIYVVGVVALILFAQAMATIGGGLNRQMTKLLWFAAGALVYVRIGDAVWASAQYTMAQSVYSAAGELLCLAVGGYVMARWFLTAKA